MTPERHARIKEVFIAASEVEKERREAWLLETCGEDEDLRNEVNKLLAHYTEPKLAVDQRPPFAATGTSIPIGRVDREETTALSARNLAPAAPSRHFPPGMMLGKRYRIVCILGRGGMGEVFRAEDIVLGQNVALKFLPAHLAHDPRSLIRLRNEVRLARRITHPYVCRVHDLAQAEGEIFLSMEYVEGEDLRHLLNRIDRLPYEKALQLSREICFGVAAAHAKRIVHRDLKPANIMVDGLGHAKITDFGLAAIHDQIARAEIKAGTPDYMAPEQLDGRGFTFKSDIYALGLVLYEVLTGESAFRARSAADDARVSDQTPPPLPSSLVEQIDPRVEQTVLRCLDPDPARRPASAALIGASLGSDAIASAMAAGETLPPDIVAAAGDEREHRSMPRWAITVPIVLLMLLALLSRYTHPIQRMGLNRSPESLADSARAIQQALGLPPPGEELFGFDTLPACRLLSSLPMESLAARRVHGESIVFWYRTATQDVVPSDAMNIVFGNARVTAFDPLDVAPGNSRMLLDASGRLLSFETNPPLPPSSQPATPDAWNALLAKADINAKQLKPVDSSLTTKNAAQSAQAWIGTLVDKTQPLRIEALVDNGHPLLFGVLSEEAPSEERSAFQSVVTRGDIIKVSEAILVSLLAIIAVPLARTNMRRGLSDPRGARRLAVFVFSLRALSWLLQASHVTVIAAEWKLFVLMLAGAIAEAGLVWFLYVALEPYARRFWPQTLISWSRVLRGHFADSRVGRDVLVGCVLGAVLALVLRADLAVSTIGMLGSRPPVYTDRFFDCLRSLRMAWGFYCNAMRNAIYMGLAFMLLIVLLRNWLKNEMITGLLALLLICPIFIPRGGHQWLSPLLIGGGVAICVWSFMRLGLLPIITGAFVAAVLYRTPLTFSTLPWYADLSFMAILLYLVLASWGYWLARRGTSLNPSPLA